MKQAKVAKVIDEYKVVLNVGADDGVRVHSEFILYRIGTEVIDPDSGESLGNFEEVIGRGIVTHVQTRLATLEASETLDGGRKIIRKSSPYRLTSISGMFGADTEEIVEAPDKAKPFRNAIVGDFAKVV
ncbi:hypothetical protein [Mesorhizobium sp. CAU 1732]|uniref:hypothetical protein n=1 Tax=Mesorhizobium sp. CAU 1732 TaxID=3140358 RepID=UPI003260E25A